MYTVIGGDASHGLARKLARKLGARYIGARVRVFPDGECKMTLGSRPAGTAVVVQSTHPPVDSNLVRALSLIHEARRHSDRVIAVIPYMGYARQDREFLAGEITTMDVVARLFQAAGAKRLVVVDMHSTAGLKKFRIPARNVSAIPALAARLKRMRLADPLVVSPDAGGAGRAQEFAGLFGSGWASLKKHRDRRTGGISISDSDLHVAGRDVILIDDMISTGGSIVEAARFLRRRRCKRIFVACTHALLVGDAKERIIKAGVSGITSANTIPVGAGTVDVSGIIAEAIPWCMPRGNRS